MKPRYVYVCCIIVALSPFNAEYSLNHAEAAQEDLQSTKDGFQVLARGPIHEAFAETVTYDPQPGIVVSKSPPATIEELPPDQRPEGDNIAWIPGYWGWDDERNDYLWVSGIWRALPPGRQWVPGYWAETVQGFQWSPGYWADADVSEIEYLPPPPPTAEAGPNIAAPSADHLWAPGCWVWLENRYAWRPGYWMPAQPNWVWVPAHYVCSPQGYLFVDGYYDYAIDNRGILFAPIYVEPSIYARQGFTYQPSMAINLAVFASQLFLRPDYSHYYYGDYYGANYSSRGFHPPFLFNSRGYGYDPFYAQQFWKNRTNPGWARSVQDDFQYRVEHEDARPPRSLAAQQARSQTRGETSLNNLVVATSIDSLSQVRDGAWRFQAVTEEEQKRLVKDGRDIYQFAEARQKLEAAKPLASVENLENRSKSTKLQLPKSPLVAKSRDHLNQANSPPARPNVPQLDSKVFPNSRRAANDPGSSQRQAEAGRSTQKSLNPEVTPAQPNGRRVDPKIEPNPGRKAGPQPSPRGEPKAGSKGEAQPAPRAEPNPGPKVAPQPVPRVEPKPAPKVEPQPAPRVEPKPAPKVEPRPAPRVEPKPAPQAEPRPAPRVEPKPAPKVEPQAAPRVEPKSASRVQQQSPRRGGSKPSQNGEPRSVPKGESKPKGKPEKAGG